MPLFNSQYTFITKKKKSHKIIYWAFHFPSNLLKNGLLVFYSTKNSCPKFYYNCNIYIQYTHIYIVITADLFHRRTHRNDDYQHSNIRSDLVFILSFSVCFSLYNSCFSFSLYMCVFLVFFCNFLYV